MKYELLINVVEVLFIVGFIVNVMDFIPDIKNHYTSIAIIGLKDEVSLNSIGGCIIIFLFILSRVIFYPLNVIQYGVNDFFNKLKY